jgi:hypothetical protein
VGSSEENVPKKQGEDFNGSLFGNVVGAMGIADEAGAGAMRWQFRGCGRGARTDPHIRTAGVVLLDYLCSHPFGSVA